MNRLPEVKPRAGVAKLSQAREDGVKGTWVSIVKHQDRREVNVDAWAVSLW